MDRIKISRNSKDKIGNVSDEGIKSKLLQITIYNLLIS